MIRIAIHIYDRLSFISTIWKNVENGEIDLIEYNYYHKVQLNTGGL